MRNYIDQIYINTLYKRIFKESYLKSNLTPRIRLINLI